MQQKYITTAKRWMLCLNEKLAMALHEQDNILNKRTEIVSKCTYSINKTWQIMTPKINTKSMIKST